ncbi:hypothetical protein LPW11_02660 [Geomonas sp. RF6]|uniref:hypothetical protein n=1 Tax=Geomonas sp. RF6 TaxID=2897342 RepID=UPI001E5EBB29|nr:hypothetical protein [Geomonas sp. RF6]UFS71100.1 hypothetical protein LPW11_02660 [Geomonas sp. RF6]
MGSIYEEALARAYYHIKPFLPRRVQIGIRSTVARAKRKMYQETWPIDRCAAVRPDGWRGWPDGKEFAFVLTHDVDTARGVQRCGELMDLERELGFVSSFNFVAQDYNTPAELRKTLEGNGFEVGVHGIEHSRKLYESEATFAGQAAQINAYLRKWGVVGFRSPCMYHNFQWLRDLEIVYDASSFDTDPFEPQSDGVRTIFPITMPGKDGFVELPYTLPQDFTLFVLLKETGIGVWKEKLRWVAEHGGMALVITHPDYICFSGTPRFEEYPAEYYRELLLHLKEEYAGRYWQALPREVAHFWSERETAAAGTTEREEATVEVTAEVAGTEELLQPGGTV